MSRQRTVIGALVGGIAMLVVSYSLTILTAAAAIGGFGTAFPRLDEQMVSALSNTLGMRVLGVLFVAFAAVVGGYVAAVISRRAPLLSAALSSWLIVFSGVYSLLVGGIGAIGWPVAVLLLLMPVLAAFGGYLYLRLQLDVARDERAFAPHGT